MLNVSDNPTGRSYAYIRKDFETEPRANVTLDFEFTPNITNIRDIFIALMRGESGSPLVGIIMGADGYVKLKTWNYNTYPSQKAYPGAHRYPKGTRRTFPPFYPSSNVRPGQKGLYPPFYPSTTKYPTVTYSGESANYYPGNSQPKPKNIVNAEGKTSVTLTVNNREGIQPEVNLFAEREGLRGNYVYVNSLNWKFNTIKTVDLGCVHANQTPYNLSFDKINLSGDVPSDSWYLIRDFQGFKVDDADKDLLWEGAVDINDSSTYTAPTKLANLARYDYARPYTTNPQGEAFTWGERVTINSLQTKTFVEGSYFPPKGMIWTMP